MKDTGMARRVDQLGRIVLPMEIRKKLKIVEGTLLNLSLDGEVIKLEKYSPILNFKQYAEDVLKECGDFTYLLCDDSTIVIANKSYSALCNGKIENEQIEKVQDFEIVNDNISFTHNYISTFEHHLIFAIKKDGDLFGHLVFSFDKEPSNEVFAVCKFISKYISSKL